MKIWIRIVSLAVALGSFSSVAVSSQLKQGVPDVPNRRDIAEARASGKVGEKVLSALEKATTTKVIVAFRIPHTNEARGVANIPDLNTAVAAERRSVFEPLSDKGFRILREFESVNIVEANVSAQALVGLSHDSRILRIDAPEPTKASLAQAGPLTNLDQVHLTGTGSGVSVAILDTGIRTSHSDFTGRVVSEQCYCTGCCPNGQDTQTGSGSAADGNGHGTHVSGIAAGAGVVSPAAGGAPTSSIHAIKVLSDSGGGTITDVTAGLDWIINNPGTIKVVNISVGTSTLFTGDCDTAYSWTIGLATAIDTLRSNGIATVVAAGNEGSTTQMAAPACIANALSVGNTYDAALGSLTWSNVPCTDEITQVDQVACSSNRNGSTDLYAPGALITSSWNASDTDTSVKGGTSMAAPLVAGCAAVIMADFDTLTVEQLEGALESSPTVVSDLLSGTNIPRVDCADAYRKAAELVTIPGASSNFAWMVPINAVVIF